MSNPLSAVPRTWAGSTKIEAADIAPGAVDGTALGTGVIVSSNMNETLLKVATVTLTNAQVLALRATPITIVSAPGAGKIIEFISVALFFDRTAVYTETADNLAVKYDSGTGVQVSQDIEATGFVDAAADAYTLGLPKIDPIAVKTLVENKALVLHNTGDGEYGGGNAANVIRVRTQYRVHPTLF